MSISELPLPWRLDRTAHGAVAITAVLEDRLRLAGTSNTSPSPQQWADEIAAPDDEGFVEKAAEAIYWSAWANNNPTSDYHWQASACYYEAMRRGDLDLYQRAYDEARARAGL